MGWNGTGRESGSASAGGDKLTSATITMGSVNGYCYQQDTGRQATGNGAPITVTLTVTQGSTVASASATTTANNIGVTEDSSGNRYPVSYGSSCTFTFNTSGFTSGQPVSWSASWSGVLACGSGGSLSPNFSWSSSGGGGGGGGGGEEPGTEYQTVTRTITLNGNGNGYYQQVSNNARLPVGQTGPVYVNIDGYTTSWDDHIFLGWFDGSTQKTGTQTLYSDVTYYAHWKTVVRFDMHGGEYSFPEYWQEMGTSMTLPASIPIRQGYDFHSWIDTTTGDIYAPGDTFTFNQPTLLGARWVRRRLTVNVYKNLPLSAPDVYNRLYGQTIDLTGQQMYQDYRFVGWDTDEHLTGITKSQNINCLWDITDYYRRTAGSWRRPFEGYGNYVTWIAHGARHTEFRHTGESCLNPTGMSLTWSGYTFIGWVEDTSSSTPLSQLRMTTDQITLYALWRAN